MWRTLGQQSSIEQFSRGIAEDNIHHAYLFVGPAHTGKKTLAVDLACALNCDGDEKPCGTCNTCHRILEEKHADVIITTPATPIDDESNGQSEDGQPGRSIRLGHIHNLQHTSSLPPFEGRRKILIIDNADRMTDEAANCLLKTLEEPPPYITWILIAEDEDRILETVTSRCQRIDVRPLPSGELESHLCEALGAPPEQAHLLACVSQGRTGWAVSALTDESVLAGRSSRIESIIQLIHMGYAARFDLSRELDAQFKRDRAGALETLDGWSTWWRDLLVTKGGCAESIVNVDYVNDLNEQAARLTLEQIRDSIKKLDEARENLDLNVIPRLVFDSLVYSIPHIVRPTGESGTPAGVLQDKNVTQ
ncbi:MAG: hypothetical protein JW846_04625 [Dehalococcoidia bacterium]|nr:hypothetical protein [Dehalococcoidia bacterium]